jgi:cytochrome c oxidase assembly factor CtaG
MRIGDAMRRILPPGSLVLFLFFLAGIWLTMSPFVMTTQPSGQRWIASTINNVTLGGVLMVVSLLGILAYLAFALRDLVHEVQTKQETDQETASS